MSFESALLWSERLLAVALALQSAEMLRIREAFRPGGVWDWELLRADFATWPRAARAFLDATLAPAGFRVLLILQLLAAIGIFVGAPLFALVFVTTALVSLRWRGSFNGGSDAMTLVAILGIGVAHAFRTDPAVGPAALGFVAFQCVLSYFRAGWAKLCVAEWRDGRALRFFLRLPNYDVPPSLARLVDRPRLARGLSLGLLCFELLFPLTLFSPSLALTGIALGLAFHAANFAAFGLNRFFWVWAATYPALYYASHWRGVPS